MKQIAQLTIKTSKALPQPQSIPVPPLTLWETLTENQQLQMVKYLAELIRRATALPTIKSGGSDENS